MKLWSCFQAFLIGAGLGCSGGYAAEPQESDALPEAARWQKAQRLLLDRCAECHGPDAQESKLRLDSRHGIRTGGDFGAIVEAEIEESEIIKRIRSRNSEIQMPPGDPLEESEIEAIRDWIQAGYPWEREEPEGEVVDDAGDKHWAWQPLVAPEVPDVSSDSNAGNRSADGVESPRNPIDHFIRDRLSEIGLDPSRPADRKTLVKRLSFDLLGVPPTFEEIERFVSDQSPTAYEDLVDRYLNSPRYGERWGRHWLDVVHYGDTHGYDKDQPRNNAWPYRDYVVQSLNADKSYAQFIREQIAGDVLRSGDANGVVATGFLSAGPWDQIGHLEVPETKTDGKIARHLDRDDMVANTIGTFCSITIHCAQCHNHKFDPIPQSEYYSLQSVFAAIDRGDRPYSDDPQTMRGIIETEQGFYESQRRHELIKSSVGANSNGLYEKWVSVRGASLNGNKTHGGFHSQIAPSNSDLKWVQIDLGEPTDLGRIVLHPCYDDFASIGAGFGFPVAYRVEVSNQSDFSSEVRTVFEKRDGASPHGSIAPISFPDSAVSSQEVSLGKWRYVRVTATELAKREDGFIFALAECEVWDEAGVNVALGKEVTSLDSIEAPDRWRKSNLVDGKSSAIAVRNQRGREKETLAQLIEVVGAEAWEELQVAEKELAAFQSKVNQFANQKQVYAASTKIRRGIPRPIHLLSRGNVNAPREEMFPGALGIVRTLSKTFELEDLGDEGARRVALADWIASPENPLTWRSMVNRLWQYHFGNGIVATASDFGMMGTAPTHPELLDWLAVEFLRNDASIKYVHRLIVTSATYRQASEITEQHRQLDASNLYLARFSRQRLDAESIRDAVLVASGNMDYSMGGPGWRDFKMVRPEHSPHYRYDLADPNDVSTWRRAIYRFIARSQTQPFLTALDCADPSMRVEKRNSSITALQSLAMLNNSAVLVQARELAARLSSQSGGVGEREIQGAFQSVLGRLPDEGEQAVMLALRDEAGLENVCRVLFNLNEFVFVD